MVVYFSSKVGGGGGTLGDSIQDTEIEWGTGAGQVSLDDIPNGVTVKLGQNCSTAGSPEFAGLKIGSLAGILLGTNGTVSAITNGSVAWDAASAHVSADGSSHSKVATAYNHVSNNGTDHSYINQSVTSTSDPTFNSLTLTTDLTLTAGGSILTTANGNIVLDPNGSGYVSFTSGATDNCIVTVEGTQTATNGGAFADDCTYTGGGSDYSIALTARIGENTTTYYGLSANNSISVTKTLINRYGVFIGNPTGAGLLTNNYGLYIESQVKGGTLNWEIFGAGPLRLGTTANNDISLLPGGSGKVVLGALSGLLLGTAGTVSAVTNGSSDWNAAYAHVSASGSSHSDVNLATAHISANGSSHSYLGQNVSAAATPTFAGLTIGTLGGILLGTAGTVSAITNGSTNWNAAYSHVSNVGTDHSYITQSLTSSDSPSFNGLTLAGDITLTSGGTIGTSSNGDITLDPNGIGEVKISDTLLKIGEGADADILIYANNGDVNLPNIKYQSSGSKWQYSNDGLAWSDLGAGPGGGATVALDNLVAVACNLSLVSDTDDTDDLGTSDKQWKDIYSDGIIYSDGLSIDGSIVSSAATDIVLDPGTTGTTKIVAGSSGCVLILDGISTAASGAGLILNQTYSGGGTLDNLWSVPTVGENATALLGIDTGVSVADGKTLGTYYGFYVTNPVGTGTITTNYGLYFEDQTKGGTNWDIYSAGDLNIGTAATKDIILDPGTSGYINLVQGGATYSVILDGTNTVASGSGMYINGTFSGGGNLNYLMLNNSMTAAAASVIDLNIYSTVTTYAATARYGIYLHDPSGTGTITTNYGLYIETQTKGGTNYDIGFSGAGTINSVGALTLQTSAGDAAINLTPNGAGSVVISKCDINAGTIDGSTIATSDITVGAGKTLNVSAGTLTLADNQISGDKVEGGTIAAITITSLTSPAIQTADNAASLILNIPVAGADAGAHTLSLQIDGNTGISIAATGDGGGGVGARTISIGVSAQADTVTIGDANAIVSLTDAHWSMTEAGVLSIVSMGANWTNASRTVADMGIVTTIDLNGGTIDGTSIGASSASTIIGTTIQANTGFVPDADGGAYLGTTALSFSGLFIDTAGTINFEAGDVVITHSANKLAFSGATSGYTHDDAGIFGYTAKLAVGALTPQVQVMGTTAALSSLSIGSFSATAASGGALAFYRSDNAAIGSATVVAQNDSLGMISWYGAQQTGTFATQNLAAKIECFADAVVTSGAGADMPGRIVFSTSPDGSGTPTDRLILDCAGVFKPAANDGVALGTTALSYADLFLASAGVINWNAGNVTLTHAAGVLTLSAGTQFKVDHLSESTGAHSIVFDTNWTAASRTCADLGTVTTGVFTSLTGGTIITASNADLTIQPNGTGQTIIYGLSRPVTTKTGVATLTVAESGLVIVTNAGASYTLTLPACANNTGLGYIFKKTDANTNPIVIDGNGAETIDGAANQTLDAQYETLAIISDGSNWHKMTSN